MAGHDRNARREPGAGCHRGLTMEILIPETKTEFYKNRSAPILTPTTPEPAFAIGEKSDDHVAMHLNDVLTVRRTLGLRGKKFIAKL